MQAEKDKKIGLLIMTLGIISFFVLLYFFRFIDAPIAYNDPINAVKMFFTFFFALFCFYFGLSFICGKKVALQIAGGLGIFAFGTKP